MPIVSGGGAGGPAAGSYLPVANKSGITVDTTTYNDTIKGSGKLTTLVAPGAQGALAFAITGDAFPRVIWDFDPRNDGLSFGDGSFDPTGPGPQIIVTSSNQLKLVSGTGASGGVLVPTAADVASAPRLNQLSPLLTIVSGALPTVQLVSATGAQILTARDAETVTPFTGDGTNNAATCAIAISPDNLTYSTVATISIAAALNLTGVLTDTVNARVPAGWYLKLTVSHGTLGLTTYY